MVRLYERDRSPYWYAEITVAGVPKRISTGVPKGSKTRTKAAAAAEQKRAELERDANKGSSITLQELWLLWSRKVNGVKPATVDRYGSRIVHFIHALKNPRISEITPAALRAYMRERREVVKDTTLLSELAALGSVIEWGIDQDIANLPEINPVRMVRKKHLQGYVPTPRWLKPEELRRIVRVIQGRPFYRDLIPFFLETGMRSEEVLGLKWSEVDLDRGVIMLEAMREKSSKGRVVPLSSTGLRTLLSQKRYPNCPFVFVNPRTRTRYKSIRPTWHRIRTEANVPHAKIHDLRHTFATWLRHQGVPKEDRMAIMGHSSEEVHAAYSDVSLTVLRDHIEKHSPNTLLAHVTRK